MSITLGSKIRIFGIHKSTKAKFFSKVKFGDILSISMVLSNTTTYRGVGATMLIVKNLVSGDEIEISQSNLVNRLDNFKYEQGEFNVF